MEWNKLYDFFIGRGSIESKDGAVDSLEEAFDVKTSDADLIALKKEWMREWSPVESDLKSRRETLRSYYLGDQYANRSSGGPVAVTPPSNGKGRNLVDNRIYTSVETVIPIATRQQAMPLVKGDDTPEGQQVADRVSEAIVYQQDRLRVRLKTKRLIREWLLGLVGVVKYGWDRSSGDIAFDVVPADRFIFDPRGYVEEGGRYRGRFLGERRKDSADVLAERFPGSKAIISDAVKGKMGTKIVYVEWWTDDMVFWTLSDDVLGKSRNPHWNWTEEVTETDEYGEETTESLPGFNHLEEPQIPYSFFTVFDLGLAPFDATNPLEQNLAMQDLINKRLGQIDKNLDRVNGGLVVSLEKTGLTKEEASELGESFRRGATMAISSGDAREGVAAVQGVALPGQAYEQLQDARLEFDNVFGTHATTRGERGPSETATGRVLLKQGDESRLGLISDYLEQIYDRSYNWFLQLMLVHYAEAVVFPGSRGLVKFDSTELAAHPVWITVKEGSLVPRDDMSRRAEAMELFGAGALDPVTLFEILDMGNPEEMAMRLAEWRAGQVPGMAPQMPQSPAETAGGEAAIQPTIPSDVLGAS